jgi:hypothetical protein
LGLQSFFQKRRPPPLARPRVMKTLNKLNQSRGPTRWTNGTPTTCDPYCSVMDQRIVRLVMRWSHLCDGGVWFQDDRFEGVLARYYSTGESGDLSNVYFNLTRAYSPRVSGYVTRAMKFFREEMAGKPATLPSETPLNFGMIAPLELTDSHQQGRHHLALFDRRHGVLPDAEGAAALATAAICVDAGFAIRTVRGEDGKMYVCAMEASDGSGLPRTQIADVVFRHGLGAESVKRDSSPLAGRHDKWTSKGGPDAEELAIMVEQAMLELQCGFALILRFTSPGAMAMREAIQRSGLEMEECGELCGCSSDADMLRYRRRGDVGAPWQYVYCDWHFQTMEVSLDGGPDAARINASRCAAVVQAVRNSPLCQGESGKSYPLIVP